MLLPVYVFFSAFNLVLFFLCLFLAMKEGKPSLSPLIFFFVPVFSWILSINSMKIEQVFCNPITVNATASGNVTSYENQMLCINYVSWDRGLAWFWLGMSGISAVVAIVYTLIYAVEKVWPR